MLTKNDQRSPPPRVTSPAAADWEHLQRSDPEALPTQSLAWSRAIVGAGRFRDVSRLYTFQDGTTALLPLFAPSRLPTAISAWRSPPPAWGFGGAISSEPLGAGHIAAILDDCATLPSAAVQIRPNPLLADLWADAAALAGWTAVPRSAHVLNLAGGFEEVWTTRISGKTRSKVRRATKGGVEISSGTGDEFVEIFDALFRLSIQRWARRQNEFGWLAAFRGRFRDPSAKFSAMARFAGPALRIWVAKLEGRPVAASVVLTEGNAHFTRSAMDDRHIGNSYANHLLQCRAIEAACEAGCGAYHMGETGGSASLAQFKSSLGAIATPYAEYRFERLPLLSADERLRAGVKKAIGFRDA